MLGLFLPCFVLNLSFQFFCNIWGVALRCEQDFAGNYKDLPLKINQKKLFAKATIILDVLKTILIHHHFIPGYKKSSQLLLLKNIVSSYALKVQIDLKHMKLYHLS